MAETKGVAAIAQALGLANSSVSRALNGAPDVSEKTRKRVVEKANELGYRPNRAAQRLRSPKGIAIVGYILTPVVNRFAEQQVFEALDGLNEALGQKDVDLTLHLSRSQSDELRVARNIIESGLVDAVIFGQTKIDDERASLLRKLNAQFGTFGRTGENVPERYVDIDRGDPAIIATKLLLSSGYSKPALFAPEGDQYYAQALRSGYETAMSDAGLISHIERVPYSAEAAETVARRMMQQVEADSIVCANDVLAEGVYKAAAATGRRIGEDFGVTGFGATREGLALLPALTTFASPTRELGTHLADLLLDPNLPNKVFSAELKTAHSHLKAG